jgi:hypothetical protein|tara:strand:- start:24 stop:464 length:441 start_codon:yes stop_codon:yes gene_type:complete
MKLISHRGNITGRIPNLENDPDYIKNAIHLGYDVEIDIWYKNGLWLGHDEPQYKTYKKFLLLNTDKLWIHCKNFEALTYLLKEDLRLFYHEKESYTIISNKLVWAHNINNVDENCIIPLLSKKDVEDWHPVNVYGVCSDYIGLLND